MNAVVGLLMDMVFYPLGFKEKLIIFAWNAHFKHM